MLAVEGSESGGGGRGGGVVGLIPSHTTVERHAGLLVGELRPLNLASQAISF